MLRERLESLEGRAQIPETKTVRNRPTGWEPGVVWNGETGTITTDALHETPNEWSEILEARGLDPEMYEVVGDTIKWCSYDGWKRGAQGEDAVSAICYSFRADIRRRSSKRIDLEGLYKDVRKVKPPKKAKKDGDNTLLVGLADWQTGNGDFGGIEATVEAIAALPEKIVQRLTDLRKAGQPIGTVCIAGLGDLIENCQGFYAAQQFRTEIDTREQTKMVRRALRDIIMKVAPEVPSVKVVCVPSNHGEKRVNGKSITRVGDNLDVEIFEQVAEILSANPDAYGHVQWRIPNDEIAVAVELSGQLVAFTHGHQARGGSESVKTMNNWWSKQAFGRAYPGVADATILVHGHFHHLAMSEQAGRLLVGTPSLTKVSEYWADATGETTAAGTLSFVIAPDGWGDLKVI
jgi:predicted phosphodiesterase